MKTFLIRTFFFFVVLTSLPQPSISDFGDPRVQSVSTADVAVGNGASFNCQLSSDGRHLIFDSVSTNLVTPAPSGVRQIYAHDRLWHGTRLVSASSAPANIPGDSESSGACISADGRFVAYESLSNYLTSTTNVGVRNVFRRDLQTGTTLLASYSHNAEHTSFASGSPGISADGSMVAFLSLAKNIVATPADSSELYDVFVTRPDGGASGLVSSTPGASLPNGSSNSGVPSFSGDGKFVAFGSSASDLVSGDTNGVADVFVRNLDAGTTELVSRAPSGELFSTPSRALGSGALSQDGRLVLFAVESVPEQIYLRDRIAGTTVLISAAVPGGAAGNATSTQARMSPDGRFVVFRSAATNLKSGATRGGVFLLDRQLGDLSLIDADGAAPCLSADASVIGYEKYDSASAQSQIYVRELDQCPQDPSKESPGACGCGNLDTDTDQDSAPDCVEGCPSDPDKLEPGTCGCGVPDVDQNGNQTTDCQEPWYQPKPPRITVKGASAQVRMQQFAGVQYQVSLIVGKKTKTRIYRTSRVILKNLKAGVYKLSYRVIENSGGSPLTGAASRSVSFRVK